MAATAVQTNRFTRSQHNNRLRLKLSTLALQTLPACNKSLRPKHRLDAYLEYEGSDIVVDVVSFIPVDALCIKPGRSII